MLLRQAYGTFLFLLGSCHLRFFTMASLAFRRKLEVLKVSFAPKTYAGTRGTPFRRASFTKPIRFFRNSTSFPNSPRI